MEKIKNKYLSETKVENKHKSGNNSHVERSSAYSGTNAKSFVEGQV